MQLYFDLLTKTIFPLSPFVSYLLILSSLIYLLYKKQIIAFITLFLAFSIIASGTVSEAYYQQLLPFIIISLGYFLSRFLNSTRTIIIFFMIFISSSIFYLYKTNFMSGFSGYGLSLQDKISWVKKVGYYPQKFTFNGPGQEFDSVTTPYEYLFWYYYKTQKPDTFVVLNEYLQMIE